MADFTLKNISPNEYHLLDPRGNQLGVISRSDDSRYIGKLTNSDSVYSAQNVPQLVADMTAAINKARPASVHSAQPAAPQIKRAHRPNYTLKSNVLTGDHAILDRKKRPVGFVTQYSSGKFSGELFDVKMDGETLNNTFEDLVKKYENKFQHIHRRLKHERKGTMPIKWLRLIVFIIVLLWLASIMVI